MKINIIFKVILLILVTAIWSLMIFAKNAEYDVNYGYAIYAFTISLVAFMALLVIWIKMKKLIMDNLLASIAFLITSSPLSLIIFVEFYGKYIGQYFKF